MVYQNIISDISHKAYPLVSSLVGSKSVLPPFQVRYKSVPAPIPFYVLKRSQSEGIAKDERRHINRQLLAQFFIQQTFKVLCREPQTELPIDSGTYPARFLRNNDTEGITCL